MASVNQYPDATIATAGTLTGGATLHAVLADASSASYTTVTDSSGWGKVSATAPTKPAGSVTKSIQLAADVSSISVNTTRVQGQIEYGGNVWSAFDSATVAGTTPQTIVGPVVQPGDLSAAELGTLVTAIRRAPTGAVTNARFYDSWVNVIFAEQPTTTILTPVTGGTSTSTDILVTWAHTAGADGGPQVWWRGVVTDGFTGTVVQDTGIVAASNTLWTFSGLAPGRTYAFTIYTAQQVYAGQPHWSTGDFTYVTITPASTAEVLSVVADPDPVYGALLVTVERDTAEDAWDRVELERNYDFNSLDVGTFASGAGGLGTGWTEFTVNTPTSTSKSLETTGGWDGQFQRLNATLDFGDFYWIGTAIDATPGALLRLSAMVKGTLGADCACALSVVFSTDPTATVSQIYASPSSQVDQYVEYGTTWSLVEVAPTFVPDDARRMAIVIGVVGLSGATAAACTIDIDNVLATQGGFGWHPVRGADEETIGADEHTFADFWAPPDREVRYRARAVIDTGPVVGQWVYSVVESWEVLDGLWLKSPNNPNVNLNVCPAGWPTDLYPRRFEVSRSLGSTTHLSTSDVLMGPTGELMFEAVNAVESAALAAILAEPVVLIQYAAAYDIAPFWAQLGEVRVERAGVPGDHLRYWSVPYWVVTEP